MAKMVTRNCRGKGPALQVLMIEESAHVPTLSEATSDRLHAKGA